MGLISSVSFGFAADTASPKELACWDRHSRQKRPVITALVHSDQLISSLNDSGVRIEGYLKGVPNPRAYRFKDFNYFTYRDSQDFVFRLILPNDVYSKTSYFHAAAYGFDTYGKGITYLNCRLGNKKD